MDDSVNNNTYCSEYVYSEQYFNFVVRYNNDIQQVYDRFSPACITTINNQFLVAYSRISDLNIDKMFEYGYEFVPKCYGLMDTSAVVDTGADRVRNLPGLRLTGRNTLIGFLDTGIDYTMNIFRNADGTTRIKAIWDQTIEEGSQTGNSAFGFGAVYTEEEINLALAERNPYQIVPTRDENGHGTFLASVAAGGENSDGTFSGVATECGIVMVKLKSAKKNLRDFYRINDNAVCYGEDDVMLGVRFLIDTAARLGIGLVICLGIGSNQGDHNGNTILESYLSYLSRQRAICIVSPAGNELGYGSHYAGRKNMALPSNETSEAEAMEIYVGENDKGFAMEIWGNSPALLSIEILSPTGERRDNFSPLVNSGRKYDFIFEGTQVYVENVVVEGTSGNQLIFLQFTNPATGIWTIFVRESVGATGKGFDAWLPISGFLNSDTRFVRPEPDVTICSPGNAGGPITVAGYDHYTNAIYVNSSRGYTRSGSIKPDITAPAVNVYGAFARSGGVPGEIDLFTRSTGTSVASALTAGVASLIMEWGLVRRNNVNINTGIIKQMIIRGVKRVADTNYPNRAWGWGVLDVYGVFEVMRNV